jgi:hypothetical protein
VHRLIKVSFIPIVLGARTGAPELPCDGPVRALTTSSATSATNDSVRIGGRRFADTTGDVITFAWWIIAKNRA